MSNPKIQRPRSIGQFASDKFLFDRVVSAYIQIVELPLLSAAVYDPDDRRQRILNNDSLNFKIDVEVATERALGDFPDLQHAWFRLACGEDVASSIANRVVTVCVPTYRRRGVDPNTYFLRHWETLKLERRAA